MLNKFWLFTTLLFFIFSCSKTTTVKVVELDGKKEKSIPSLISEGNWLGKLDIGEGNYIPFNFQVKNNELIIVNSSEKISCSLEKKKDSIHFKLPVFNSEFFLVEDSSGLNGYWYNFARKNYTIPFTAKKKEDIGVRFDHSVVSTSANFEGKWESTFGLSGNETYKAIGVFEQSENLATGTFITETGDYRFLQGNVIEDTLLLSCFDGSHAFLFRSYQKEDSLFGEFFSGKHYKDKWVAVRNENFQLAHPDSLTYIVPGQEFTFDFPSVSSNERLVFPSDQFAGKVTLVQIFGSWCPNCMDEVEYYTNLYKRYHDQGLEIIGLGFELPETLEEKTERILDLIAHTNAPYHFAIGGNASKDEAKDALPSLNHVMSFPTTIFIDRSGSIKKIHTGFYGPGTGSYYHEYKQEIEQFIESLLHEA